MHSIAFASLEALAAVYKILAYPEAVARQDEAGEWFLDVPPELAETAEALANGSLPPPAPSKAELLAYLKDRRWQIEISGVNVTIGGEAVLVSTARGDDRTTLHQTYSAIKDGLRADGATFNFADGLPRAVSNADMMAAALGALAHVQAAFDLEGAITPQIHSGQILTTAEVDTALAANAP